MALSDSTLASGLEALEPTTDESVAANRLATAFVDYFAESTVLGTQALKAPLEGPPKAAMVAAMLGGLSAPGGGAAAILAGCTAFWNALLGIEPTIWVLPPPAVVLPATIILPPTLPNMAATLAATFLTNTQSALPLPDAAAAVAIAMGSASQLAGSVQTQVPPAAPVTTPII